MIQAEGIFTDWLILRKIIYRKGDKAVPFLRENENNKEKILLSLNAKIKNTKQHFKNDRYDNLIVNTILDRSVDIRNSILHGENIKYAIAKHSNQMLLLVFVLASSLKDEFE